MTQTGLVERIARVVAEGNEAFWKDVRAQSCAFDEWKAGGSVGDCPQHLMGSIVDYITRAVTAVLSPAPAGEGSGDALVKEEKAHENTIHQRDAAEECVSNIYYQVVGNSPEWSNLFGFDEATADIVDAVNLLKAAARTTAGQVDLRSCPLIHSLACAQNAIHLGQSELPAEPQVTQEREGWKLVPVEMTSEMLRAVQNDAFMRPTAFQSHYRAMLAASPLPPASPQPDGEINSEL